MLYFLSLRVSLSLWLLLSFSVSVFLATLDSLSLSLCLPPPNNINTAHRGRFQVNVNPIGDSKKNGVRLRRSLRWACRASSSSNSSLSPWLLFVSCPRLKLEELFSREALLKATNRGQSTVSSSIFPTLSIITTKSNLAVEAPVRLLWQTSWRSSIKLLLWALPEWEIWTLKNPYRESHSLESDLYVRF